MNRFFSSDFHFGHTNIAGPNSNWKDGYRTFDSVHEMNRTIIDNINKMVGPQDELYFLGDFCFKQDTRKYLDQITCKNIHAIRGNHDREMRGFASVQTELWLDNIFMHHYAHRVWPKSHYGAYHLYGHSHGSLPNDWGRSMDVGIDMAYKLFGEYRPFAWEEVDAILSKRPIKFVDHHV